MTKKKATNWQNPLPVKVMDERGKIICRLSSIKKARDRFGLSKFSTHHLKDLRGKKIIRIKGYYICRLDLPLAVVKKFISFKDSVVKEDKKLKQIAKLEILKKGVDFTVIVIDSDFNLISVEYGSTLKTIGKKFKINESTIKSSLSKFKRDKSKFISGKKLSIRRSGFRFVYLKDIL